MEKGRCLRLIAFFTLSVLLALATLNGCGGESPVPDLNITDYSIPSHWLATPSALDKPVDIFYYYPTAWTCSDNSTPVICAIDEPSMLTKAARVYQIQATAFEPVGNIYAPFYRQDNDSPVNREEVIGGIPTMDGIAAFDYYVRHFNNNRPYILVGHSQGANVLSNLLADYMKSRPDVYERMIAAYVIGYAVTDDYLAENPHLKFAEGPDDTGVIISYNTQAPDVTSNPVLYAGVGNVINPISWTRNETTAPTAEGLGSFMPDPNGQFVEIPQYADARVDKTRGVLICTTADEQALYELSGNFSPGVYHSFDIPFYYFNLRQNAANRTSKFLETNIK